MSDFLKRIPWRLVLCWVLATYAVGVTAGDGQPVVASPHQATYKASVGLIPAWVEVTLDAKSDGALLYRSEVRGRSWASLRKGRIEETSELRIDGADLRPVRYEMRNGLSRKDRDIVIRFEDDGTAISDYRGEEHAVRADTPPVDLLSLRLVLASALASDSLANEYAVVDGRGRLKYVAVTDAGVESLETGAGRLEARRLEYDSGDDRRFVVWFAPALDYQMIRFEQYEEDRLRGRLVLHEYVPEAAAP